MKTFYLLALSIVFLSNQAKAQDCARNGFVSLHLGLSIPTGDYGDNNFDNVDAGFATVGSVFDITFGYQMTSKLGVSVLFRGQANGFDANTYANGFASFLRSGSSSGNPTVYHSSSAYSIGGMMAGIYRSIPMNEKLKFEPRILVGFATANLPSSTTEAYDNNTKMITFIQEQSTTVAFSYLLGASTKLDIKEKMLLFINLDFNSTKAGWKDVQFVSVGHITQSAEIRYFNYELGIRTINISTGLAVKF